VLVVVGTSESALVELSETWPELLGDGTAIVLPRISDDELAWCYLTLIN
jgi:hypothetical protein